MTIRKFEFLFHFTLRIVKGLETVKFYAQQYKRLVDSSIPVQEDHAIELLIRLVGVVAFSLTKLHFHMPSLQLETHIESSRLPRDHPQHISLVGFALLRFNTKETTTNKDHTPHTTTRLSNLPAFRSNRRNIHHRVHTLQTTSTAPPRRDHVQLLLLPWRPCFPQA